MLIVCICGPGLVYLKGQTGQLSIPRIDLMPSIPSPYNQRDWKQVAKQYDSLIYDVSKTGLYLPLISLGVSGINYPRQKTIKLHTYVGTNSPSGSEAINVLPSLVGASLVGIDKRNQFGQNWILMSQDFFNKTNGENIYLNNPGSTSGGDWWYDLMPNVFFYQLFDLYPNLGSETNLQFISVADRFLEAVKAMGGKDTPWNIPNMNYRAWKFKTMQPNAAGVKEPEAAGAYAWVLYHAWTKTQNKDYLKGAEWSIEFLNQWPNNPSYELQLPYGVYIAARMNAELGTTYNISKMLNWCFDRGALRGWGSIVGKWGGFDVSGLIGEANDGGNDYAFQLNGVQQAAALVPMVRYDKRYAKAIGKWVLNLSNATRLFYPGFLPNHLQDASSWTAVHDPKQVMGYEALREKNQGLSPFSTGDAVKGGWASTNLALYGTSSIGYLGSILEKTEVDQILQLDLLKTDFFKGPAYPTYLYYNPHNSDKTVSFNVGLNPVNLYEALTEKFIGENVSGSTAINIPANQAVMIVATPVGGTITYDRHTMLVNQIVADYRQSAQPFTKPVRIKSLAAAQQIVQSGDSIFIYGTADDPDQGAIEYKWSSSGGTISDTGKTVKWYAPSSTGPVSIQLIVKDVQFNSDTATLELSVVSKVNSAPSISLIQKSAEYISTSETVTFTALASDPNNDTLTYTWTADGGTFNNNSGRTVNWIAPAIEGIFNITVQVKDNGNLSAQAGTKILVRNFNSQEGKLLAYYPFTGNTQDISGNLLHGQGIGTVLVPDKNNKPNSAYYFNGGTQHIKVANSPILNSISGITVSCWVNASSLPEKETFLLSHGSWQNRWKLSFTPEKFLRWTVNTMNGIGDLDAADDFRTDSFYHVIAAYDGSLMTIYINGILNAYKPLTGNIRTTSLPLLMGQMLEDNAEYNFKGILDEVRLFDYALSPAAAASLFLQVSTPLKDRDKQTPVSLKLAPNPATDFLMVQSPYPADSESQLIVMNVNGQIMFEKKMRNIRDKLVVDISQLVSGVYILTMRADHVLAVARFVKI